MLSIRYGGQLWRCSLINTSHCHSLLWLSSTDLDATPPPGQAAARELSDLQSPWANMEAINLLYRSRRRLQQQRPIHHPNKLQIVPW